MALEHILTDDDTVQGLALKYLGDPSQWTSIVDFNNLEYPYIITDQQTLYDTIYAHGYIQVTRINTVGALTIHAGSTFMTHGDISGFQKVFQVVDDMTLPAGTASAYLYVRSELPGTYGNVIANSIIVVGNLLTDQGAPSDLTVTNPNALTNGNDANVLLTGMSILIPTDSTDVALTNSNIGSYLDYLGGEDLELTDAGLLDIDGSGDVSSVLGLDNIVQAVRDRFEAELQSLTRHPEYGSGVIDLVGNPGLLNVEKRIELEIHQAMAYEDRVQAVIVNSVTVQDTAVYIDLTLKIANKTTTTQIVLGL